MYQNINAARMLVAPIKSLAFDVCHQVFINTLHFTGFDKKIDAVIETAVRRLGYREAKNLQTRSINKFGSGSDVFQCYQYVLGTRDGIINELHH